MSPHPLLAVVVIIIFHTSGARQVFNKYFFLKIHTDFGLFTQVHQASQREAIVSFYFYVVFPTKCHLSSRGLAHPSQDKGYVYIFDGQHGDKSYAGRIFSNQKLSRISKHDLGRKYTFLFSSYPHPRFKLLYQMIFITS